MKKLDFTTFVDFSKNMAEALLYLAGATGIAAAALGTVYALGRGLQLVARKLGFETEK